MLKWCHWWSAWSKSRYIISPSVHQAACRWLPTVILQPASFFHINSFQFVGFDCTVNLNIKTRQSYESFVDQFSNLLYFSPTSLLFLYFRLLLFYTLWSALTFNLFLVTSRNRDRVEGFGNLNQRTLWLSSNETYSLYHHNPLIFSSTTTMTLPSDQESHDVINLAPVSRRDSNVTRAGSQISL